MVGTDRSQDRASSKHGDVIYCVHNQIVCINISLETKLSVLCYLCLYSYIGDRNTLLCSSIVNLSSLISKYFLNNCKSVTLTSVPEWK